jgi:methylglutaconyl-CoA hydratase
MATNVQIEIDGRGVATVTLNRPTKHNAISAEMIAELAETADALGGNNAVRVVVLTGAGASFCAGGDLRWMQAQITADNDTRRSEARKLAAMLDAWNTLPKPVIGRLNGNTFGGGVGMACVCDVAIGVTGSKFGLTETKLGLIPAIIGPYVVARMGEAMARRVFMSSRVFDGDEAVTLGIIVQAVDADALNAAVEVEIAPYLLCAPGAVAAAKVMARDLGPSITSDQIEATIDALVARWGDPEVEQGLSAFFAKVPPPWAMK